MQHFINEYEYTRELAVESAKIWIARRLKIMRIIEIVMAVLIAAFALWQKNIILLMVEIIPLMGVVTSFRTRKHVIEQEEDHVDALNANGEPPIIHIEIGENVTLTSPEADRVFEYSDFKEIFETEHLLIVTSKGGMFIGIAKNGFIEGNLEDCRAFLKEKTTAH